MRTNKAPKWLRIIPTVVASCAIVTSVTVGVHLHGASAAAAGTDEAALKQLVYNSQLAEQRLCLPPPSYRTQKRAQIVSPPEVQQVQAEIQRALPQFYTGEFLGSLAAVLHRNCAESMTGGQSIEIDGGVDSTTCSQITVNQAKATASCQVVKWLKSIVAQGESGWSIVDPRGPVNVVDTFARTAEGWRITDEELSSPPGTGP